MAVVNSCTLATAATNLRTFRDALETKAGELRTVTNAARTGLDLVKQTWFGPLATEMNVKLATYLEGVAGAAGAADSAKGTVDSWATAAEQASERLAGYESSLSAVISAKSAADIEIQDYQRLKRREDSLEQSISDEATEWARTCASYGTTLDPAITILSNAARVEIGTYDERASLLDRSYDLALALWAAVHQFSLRDLDPTGALSRAGAERLTEFANSEYAALMLAVIETMKQADISGMDGSASADDWLAATDYEAVLFRLRLAAELAGVTLTEAELDSMTTQIVITALFGAGADDDTRSAINDGFDEHEGIRTRLDNGAGTEHDVDFGDNPTEAEQYLKDWLETQWENDKSFGDYVAMLVLPDFNVMNPWSDDFHLGWAAIEVLGIIPIGKVGKLGKLARLAENAEDLGDLAENLDDLGDIGGAIRHLDDSTDILSDARHLPDPNHVPGSQVDDIASTVDDLPTAHLAKTDDLVVSEANDVSENMIAQLQPEVDRIWANTNNALPGASPQQLGTHAHSQLEAFIRTNGDSIVDPDTGYRLQAEVSYDSAGTVTTRNAPGSIRPDVVLERRVVDADGVATWEPVGVYDLKTGRADISSSWWGKAETRVSPVVMGTLRPG